MKNTFKYFIHSNRFLILILLGVFFYTLLTSLIFQLGIFPHFSSLSTPLGILKGDNELFHNLAVKMASEIEKNGWGAWELFPLNIAAGINVGILAVLYVFMGAKPFLILPLNALLHTLSFFLLFKTFYLISRDRWIAFLAAIPFVFLPTTLLWTSQLHKDSYAILAWILIFYCLSRLSYGSLKELITFFVMALILFIVVRPLYLNLIVLISAFLVALYIGLWFFKIIKIKSVVNSLVLLFLSSTFLVLFTLWSPVNSAKDESHFYSQQENSNAISICETFKWKDELLSSVVETKLHAIAGIRLKQICFEPIGASSTIDKDFIPDSSRKLLFYAPRALIISLFYPTPYQLLKISNIKSFPVIGEMLLFYILLPFTVWFVFKEKDLNTIVTVTIVVFCEMFLAYIIPNMGSYHRIRYPFFAFMLGIGILSLLNFIGWRKVEKT